VVLKKYIIKLRFDLFFKEGKKMRKAIWILVAIILSMTIISSPVFGDQEKPYQGIEIKVLAQPMPFWDVMEPMIPEFEKETGIKVTITYYPELERRSKSRMDAATGTGAFQVYHVDEQNVPEFAEAGWLIPIKDYYPAEYDIDDFVQAYLDFMSWKDVTYGCPFRGGTDMLMYRKDLFETENYPFPKTMEELREAAKHFNKPPDLYGISLRGERGFGMNCWLWQEYLASFGGKYFENSTPVFNSKQAVEATKFYVELIRQYGPPDGVTYSWSAMLDAFMAGKVAMLTADTDFMLWVENAEKSSVAGKVGYAPFPEGPAGRVTNSWAHGIAMSKSGNKTELEKKASALFIAWITGKESEINRVKAGQYLQIARKSTLESTEFEEQLKNFPDWIEAFREDLKSAKPLFPRMPQWPQIGDNLGIILEEIFVGTRTDIKASLDEAVAYAEKVLKGK